MNEKDWTKDFIKMVDVTPVINFTDRFGKRMMDAARERYGADGIPVGITCIQLNGALAAPSRIGR